MNQTRIAGSYHLAASSRSACAKDRTIHVPVSESPLCRQHHSDRCYVGGDDERPDGTGDLLALAFIPEGGASNVAKTLVNEKIKGAVGSSLDPNGDLLEPTDAIRQRDKNAGGGGYRSPQPPRRPDGGNVWLAVESSDRVHVLSHLPAGRSSLSRHLECLGETSLGRSPWRPFF